MPHTVDRSQAGLPLRVRMPSEPKITCSDNKFVKWDFSERASQVGEEYFLNIADGKMIGGNPFANVSKDPDPKTIRAAKFPPVADRYGSRLEATQMETAVPLSGVSQGIDKISFSYRMVGEPAALANKMMNTAKPRTCTFIWHRVEGEVSCRNGELVSAN